MTTYTKEQLAEILDKHRKWLLGETGGERADLSRANLSKANLSGADLSRANLSGANLSKANLYGAVLSRAYLSRANLSRADLSLANLYGANLSEANLSKANLYGADLSRAYLGEADLSEVRNLPCFQIVPETGAFRGWKKLADGYLAEIEIPVKAGRVSSTGRKCRAEYVKVLAIYTSKGRKTRKAVGGHRDTRFLYQAGKIVKPDKWDPDIREECTHGIHFFLTRKEAEEY